FTLGGRVRRDEREAPRDGAEEVECLAVPAGDVIEVADVLALPHFAQLLRLLGGTCVVAQERRVAHHGGSGLWGDRGGHGDRNGGLPITMVPASGVSRSVQSVRRALPTTIRAECCRGSIGTE